jgi:hypothetical protein
LPGNLPALIDQIVIPCTVTSDPKDPGALDAAIACNAHEGIGGMLRGSQIISDAVKAGNLKLVAGVQDLKTGRFTVLK